MKPVHLRPSEAVDVHQQLGVATSLAVHYGCFELSDEGPVAPVRELLRTLAERGISRQAFWTLEPGEGPGGADGGRAGQSQDEVEKVGVADQSDQLAAALHRHPANSGRAHQLEAVVKRQVDLGADRRPSS